MSEQEKENTIPTTEKPKETPAPTPATKEVTKDESESLTLEQALDIIKKREIEIDLLKTKNSSLEDGLKVVKEHEKELAGYRFTAKVSQYENILRPLYKDTKKLAEKAAEYAKNEKITPEVLESLVKDTMVISVSSAPKKEDDMISTIAANSSIPNEGKTNRGFSNFVLDYYNGVLE